MGKTKVGCKKLDVFQDGQKCLFCGTTDIDELKYGPVYSQKNIITHYFCLLLSSNMEQRGRDCDGILGFLPNDITKEVKRGSRLHCTYCKASGATLGCDVTKCKVVFHLPCGTKHGTLHQFFGQFKSFCNKHRPVQMISEKILSNCNKEAMCGICYEKVVPRPVHDTLWAPCCQKSAFFHRICVQKLAISAGYFFKCPLCNNTTLFQQTMKEFGVYIPEQDASWERVPQAYQELLVRHGTCDAANCTCPDGREANVTGTRWELILCKFCGSQGSHIGCGRLNWNLPQFECDTCLSAVQLPTQEAAPRNDNRLRLPRANRTSSRQSDNLPPASVEREADKSDDSLESSDSEAVLISRRRGRIRIVSPLPEERPETPSPRRKTPPPKKTSIPRTKERPFPTCTIVIDEDVTVKDERSEAIIVDDSDEDVEVVGMPNGKTLKTFDGRTIPIVEVIDSESIQARKKLRVVGDVEVAPIEKVVDLNIQMPGPSKKPKLPPQVTEVVYNSPKIPPKPNVTPDFNNGTFVLVDPSMMRPEDMVPGAVFYRSVQPIIPQPSQPSTVTMQQQQQQVGPARHADAQYPDLCKHWPGGCYYIRTNTIQEKTARGKKQCNSAGRRRRLRRSDMHRLNPAVKLSPLKYRISPSGHFEYIVPWINNYTYGFAKRRICFESRPLKKIKLTTNLNQLKHRMIDYYLPSKNQKRDLSARKTESPLQPSIDYEESGVFTDYTSTNVKKLNHDDDVVTYINLTSNDAENYKKKINKWAVKYKKSPLDKASTKVSKKPHKNKSKRFGSIEQWKYNTIVGYLNGTEKYSNMLCDITNKQKMSINTESCDTSSFFKSHEKLYLSNSCKSSSIIPSASIEMNSVECDSSKIDLYKSEDPLKDHEVHSTLISDKVRYNDDLHNETFSTGHALINSSTQETFSECTINEEEFTNQIFESTDEPEGNLLHKPFTATVLSAQHPTEEYLRTVQSDKSSYFAELEILHSTNVDDNSISECVPQIVNKEDCAGGGVLFKEDLIEPSHNGPSKLTEERNRVYCNDYPEKACLCIPQSDNSTQPVDSPRPENCLNVYYQCIEMALENSSMQTTNNKEFSLKDLLCDIKNDCYPSSTKDQINKTDKDICLKSREKTICESSDVGETQLSVHHPGASSPLEGSGCLPYYDLSTDSVCHSSTLSNTTSTLNHKYGLFPKIKSFQNNKSESKKCLSPRKKDFKCIQKLKGTKKANLKAQKHLIKHNDSNLKMYSLERFFTTIKK